MAFLPKTKTNPVVRSESKGSGPAAPPRPAFPPPSHAAIARRAYELYATRGYAPGDPEADWAEAERQLQAGH